MPRVLVAGIGNIFLSDDGFGVEVAGRLRAGGVGNGVDVVDYGIRGLHLAYDLASRRYDAAILVDAVARGGAPGDLYAIEPDAGALAPEDVLTNAHGLTPDRVLAWVRMVGGDITSEDQKRRSTRVMVVGCEPDTLDAAMGLSPPVLAAVDPAVQMVRNLAAEMSRASVCA